MNTSSHTTTIQYKGSLGELFALVIKNFIFTICTLGVYFFWGLTHVRTYIWQHMYFGDDHFEYTGEGSDLFFGALKVLGIYLGVTFLVFMTSWIPLINLLLPAAVTVGVFILTPVVIYLSRNYRLRNTRLRGYRLSMNKDIKSFVIYFCVDAFLLTITFGLYFPWFHNRVYGALTNRTLWGGQSFYYDGEVGDILHYYIFGFLLAPFTAGLSLFFFYGKIREYRAKHMYFQGKNFTLDVNGWDFALVGLCYITIVPATLFILEPVVRHYTIQYISSKLTYNDEVDWSTMSDVSSTTDALGEEFASFLDLDLGF